MIEKKKKNVQSIQYVGRDENGTDDAEHVVGLPAFLKVLSSIYFSFFVKLQCSEHANLEECRVTAAELFRGKCLVETAENRYGSTNI